MKTTRITKNVLLLSIVSIFFISLPIALAVMLDSESRTGNIVVMNAGGAQSPSSHTIDTDSATPKDGSSRYAPGRVIVKLKEDTEFISLMAQSYSVRSNNNARVLRALKTRYKLSKERPVFKTLHNQLRSNDLSMNQLNARLMSDKATQTKVSESGKNSSRSSSDLFPVYMLDTHDDPIEAANKLKNDPDVEYAQPDYLNQIYLVPNDPYYSSSGSWGQSYDDLWGLKKIECEQAWDISQGEGVIVAVVDTGLDYGHEDFFNDTNSNGIPDAGEQYNVSINGGEDTNHNGRFDNWPSTEIRAGVPGDINNVDNDGNGKVDNIIGWDFSGDTSQIVPDNDPKDAIGHGTFCAGTIAATGLNGKGIIGVAPKAKILPVKIFPNAYDSVCVEAVQYAADSGARVISNSWGPTYGRPSDPALESVIDYAVNVKGCVVVFAAGNSNEDTLLYSPANYSKVISVAATDPDDKKASFSNYGETVSVSAPGVGILSLCAEGTDMYEDGTHIVGDKYYYASGTSMACPHVAGLAALIIAKHPDWSQAQVRAQLVNTADDIDQLNAGYAGCLGGGRINAYRALTTDPEPLIKIVNKRIDDRLNNGDGFVEPGETVDLYLTLKNKWADASNVAATIQCDDPEVTISHSFSTASFGNLVHDASSENTVPFQFSANPTASLNHKVEFLLTITADNGYVCNERFVLYINEPVPSDNPYWMQYHKDQSNTGCNAFANFSLPLHRQWELNSSIDDPRYNAAFSTASPVIFEDTLCIGSETITFPGGYSDLYAINTITGRLKWKFRTLRAFIKTPAIFKDEDNQANYVFGDCYGNPFPNLWLDGEGWLYCVVDKNDRAQLKWIYDLRGQISSHVTVTNKYIYVVSANHLLHCIDKLGRPQWVFDIAEHELYPNNSCHSKPAADPVSGDVFVASKNLYCIKADGVLRWAADISAGADWRIGYSSPVISVEKASVFVGGGMGLNSYLYAINKNDGSTRWVSGNVGMDIDTPGLSNGFLYYTSGNFYKTYADTGSLLWQSAIGAGSPSITGDGTIFANTSNQILAMDKNTGSVLWSDSPDFFEDASPAMTSDAIYVATKNGKLVKYASTLPPTPSSPSGLEVENFSTDRASLRWTDNSNSETGFKLERSLYPDKNFSIIATLTGANRNQYSDTSLQSGTTYYYRVFAYNDGGNSGYSNVVQVTNQDTTPPVVPMVNDEGTTTSRTDRLYSSWNSSDAQSGIAEYQYKIMQDSAAGTVIRDWTSTGTDNSVTAAGLSLISGKKYYFGVRAKNNAGLWSGAGYSDGIQVNTNAPRIESVTPSNIISSPDQRVLLTTIVSDPQGATDISVCSLLIGPDNLNDKFKAYYDRTSGKFFLLDRRTGAWISAAPGTATALEGFNAYLDCGFSIVSDSGNFLTIVWAIKFKSNSLGAQNIYLGARDASGASVTENKGIWTIINNMPPQFDFSDGSALGQIKQQGDKYRIVEEDSASLLISANDPEADALTMGIVQSPASPTVTSIITASGAKYLQVSPAFGSHGTYSVTLSVWDATHNPANGGVPTSYTFNLTVGQRPLISTSLGTPSGHTTTSEAISWPVNQNKTFAINASSPDGLQITSWEILTALTTGVTITGSDSAFRTLSYNASASGVQPGTYAVTIRVKDELGNAAILQLTLVIQAVPPTAPSLLTATALSTIQIKLAWQDNSNNETGFKIERSLNGSSWTALTTVGANATTYTDSSLIQNTRYYYRIYAYNSAYNSAYSNTANVATQAVITAPYSLTAQAQSTTQTTLTWIDNSTNETGFKIERSVDGATFTYRGSVGANVTTYADSGLSANTKYYYRVYAYNTSYVSPYSNIASVTTQPVPAAPSLLTAQALSTTQIKLTWQDNSTNETGFRIERSLNGSTWISLTSSGANVTTYTDSSLTQNTRYYYRVSAYNSGYVSAYSNIANATPIVTAPSLLTAIALSTTQLKLTWQDNSTDETGFKIERSLDGVTFTYLASASANVTTYTDSGLSAGSNYWYRVCAWNGAYNSAYSNIANAIPTLIAASNLTATALSTTQITLTWRDNSSDETGFRIERSLNGTTFTYITSAGANTTIYTDSSLTPNTKYYYRVSAYSNTSGSAYSNIANAATQSVPTAPSLLTAQALSTTQIKLTWQDNSTSENGFRIWRSLNGSTWTSLVSLGANVTTYTDSSLTPNTMYYYRVSAYNSTYSSAYSNIVTPTTPSQ